jgi:hypothetical protein
MLFTKNDFQPKKLRYNVLKTGPEFQAQEKLNSSLTTPIADAELRFKKLYCPHIEQKSLKQKNLSTKCLSTKCLSTKCLTLYCQFVYVGSWVT